MEWGVFDGIFKFGQTHFSLIRKRFEGLRRDYRKFKTISIETFPWLRSFETALKCICCA